MLEWVLAEVARGHRRQLVVVVPPGATWPLPAYELAIMAATETRSVRDATVTLVTPEREPLRIFGDAAGQAMRELLAERGIELVTGARAAHVTDDVLWLEERPGDRRRHRSSAFPSCTGPDIPGLPSR